MRSIQDDLGIELVLDEPHLLRKGVRGLLQAEARFRRDAAEQMHAVGVECFPPGTALSVQLDLHLPDLGNPAHMPVVVKAHLDALESVAYHDDRQIEHLVVHRRALDHPYMAGFRPEDPNPDAHVYVQVQRLARYVELYDRAFRGGWLRPGGRSPFRGEWTWRDEAELIRLRRELKRARSAGQASSELAELVRSHEERRLRDGFLADIDRPGPVPPGARAVHRLIDLPRMHHALRRRRGAVLLLENDGLNWPHRDGLNWPRLRPIVA